MLFASMAWRNIWRNKRRTLLGMAAIFFSVLGIVCFTSVGNGFYEQAIESALAVYDGHIQINRQGYYGSESLEGFIEKPDLIRKELEQIPHVRAVTTRILTSSLINKDKTTLGCFIVGIDPEQERQVTILYRRIRQGKFLEPQDDKSVILGIDLARRLKVEIGAEVIFVLHTVTGSIGSVICKVVGILDIGNAEFNQGAVLMPQKTAAALVDYSNHEVSQFVVQVDNNSNLAPTLTAIQEKLKNYQTFYAQLNTTDIPKFEAVDEYGDVYLQPKSGIGVERNFEVLTWRTYLSDVVEFVRVEKTMQKFIVLITYATVFMIVLNLIVMAVLERKREFGIMRALGTRLSQIALLVWTETMMLTFLALILAALMAVGITEYFYHSPIPLDLEFVKQSGLLDFYIKPVLETTFLWYSVMSIVVTSLVAPLWPIWIIAKLTPVETIHAV